MAGTRLIVNADDFGRSTGINAGVVHAHEHGIVTSASLMVRWPAAATAAAYARGRPALSVGLHVDLGEWVHAGGEWRPREIVVDTGDEDAVERELERQLELFRTLLGRDPTHLDSHQHVHRGEPLRTILARAAERLSVPLRDSTPGISYDGRFYGQTAKGDPRPEWIATARLVELIDGLGPGTTELGCHPGLGDDVPAPYRSERAAELEALCHPDVRVAVRRRGAILGSFADWSRLSS